MTDSNFDTQNQTIAEKTAVLFSKVRVYYALKIMMEDNDILRGGLCGYLEHLYKEERRIGGLPESAWEKEHLRLSKIHAFRLRAIDRLLALYPGLVTMEREEIGFLINNA